MKPSVVFGGAALFVCLAAALVTWPQALHPASTLIGHHDTYFSIWRLGWIAHALADAPRDLFNGNVFYPASGTLMYSDATLLQGLLAAPLFWIGVPPALIYNLLLFIGIAGSGLAMFVLARYLTGSAGAALIAAAAFTMAPYRIEHIMHLELQWTMWIPLALWALHRTVDEASWRFGLVAGVSMGLQALSCVYYSVFLALVLMVFLPLLLLLTGRRAGRAIPMLVLAGVVAAAIALPYASLYARTADELGGRDVREVARYSARPINYFATTYLNRIWSWTADRFGGPEVRLFPGAVVLVLAAAALLRRSRRWVLLYIATTAVAVELSFGVNGAIYHWLFERIALLQGLRSTARSGIIVGGALSILAAFGAEALLSRGRRWAAAGVPCLLALMAIELSNQPLGMNDSAVLAPAPVYKVIRSAGPGVVIELPFPRMGRLPGWDAYYSLWSLQHWHPLVNGYSGYYPPDYVQTSLRMETFPDDGSMQRLKAHDVRYIVVHRDFMEADTFNNLMFRMAGRPEIRPWGMYRDPVGNAALFVLERPEDRPRAGRTRRRTGSFPDGVDAVSLTP